MKINITVNILFEKKTRIKRQEAQLQRLHHPAQANTGCFFWVVSVSRDAHNTV
jgi:quinol monooxygenase YgiN